MTFSALLFTSLSGLTVIAEFSSVTFLLVSIGVSIANIKLKDLTKADVKTALIGLVLMMVTTLTIFGYLAMENREELLSIFLIYVITAVFFFIYYKFKKS